MRDSYAFQTALALPLLVSFSSFSADKTSEKQVERIEILASRLTTKQSHNNHVIENPYNLPIHNLVTAIPSIQVNANAGQGSVNDIYLRGADPNHTLVTFNGIPLNDGTNSRGGVADISLLSHFLVDEIAISKGAKSAVYGSHAIAGVINFSAQPTKHNEAKVRIGTDSAQGFELATKFSGENIDVRLVKQRSAQHYRGSQQQNEGALLIFKPNLADKEFKATFWANNAQAQSYPDDSGGALFAASQELTNRHSQDRALSAQYSQTFGKSLLSLSGYIQDKSETIDTPAVLPGKRDPQGFPANIVHNELERQHISANIQRQSGKVEYVIGADFTREKASSTGALDFIAFAVPTDFQLTRETYGVYSEAEMFIQPNLIWHLSLRYDDSDNTQMFTPSSSLTWLANPAHKIQFEWGKGFKLPSFYALSHPLIGNPELLNEKAHSTQLNYTYSHMLGTFSSSLFSNEYENLVDFEAGPPPKLVNRSRAKTQGFELAFNSSESQEKWSWFSHYAYLDARTDTHSPLLGRAKHQASLGLEKQHPEQDISWRVQANYSGDVYGSSIPTDQIKLASNVNLSVDAKWQLANDIALSMGASNLLNEPLEYTPGNQHQGPYAWANMQFTY